ncbi:DUF1501 domain-containing protein [bacterium]|nr:DUF1501 domain-containing protein [bacterium]
MSTNRRDFLNWSTSGLMTAATWSLLSQEAAASPQAITHPAKCQRVIHLFMCGGLSHLDSFDYKPALEKNHGKPLPSTEQPETFFGQVGLLRKNDWAFRQQGKSGLWISDLFPHIATCADELTVIRSMVADSANHTPATFQANTGFRFNGFPVLGSWLSYGMGSEADDLPAYVVLPDSRGMPAGSTINWTNGFLPAKHQGVPFRTKGNPIDDLFPSGDYHAEAEAETRAFIAALNAQHRLTRPESELEARLTSYELAAKIQLSVPEVTDLAGETAQTQSAYGLDRTETADFGRSCLLARRLLEQGVRFVQLFSGGSFGSPRINWDGHENVFDNHSQEALRVDQPIAALLKDLRQRGLLDDTLVLFTTEFGRTPFTQSAKDTVGSGRDHNMYGFSTWLAGGGLKPGMSYGNTDDVGWKSVDKPVHWHDFHATVLQLLGIDHTRLTYYHNGIERRLTNVHGEVLHEILA